MTAQGFLGFAEITPLIRIAVVVVTMGLVVILYWLDTYYRTLLFGAYMRARILEKFRVRKAKLSLYTAGFFGKTPLEFFLIAIYAGFLVGLITLGAATVYVSDASQHQTLLLLLIPGSLLASGGLLLIIILSTANRNAVREAVLNLYDEYDKKLSEDTSNKEREAILRELETKIFEKMFPHRVWPPIQSRTGSFWPHDTYDFPSSTTLIFLVTLTYISGCSVWLKPCSKGTLCYINCCTG